MDIPLYLRSLLNLRRLLAGSAAAVLFAFLAAAAVTEPACAQSPPAVTSEDAKAILRGMAEFMSKLPSFSVDVLDSYDAYQKTGQKIEFGETRKITVVRPDRLRIEVNESDGDKQVLIFDGKQLTLSSSPANVFAQTPKPGTIDDAIVYFVRDLHMRLPFAAMLVSTAADDIAQRTTRLDYVEKTSLYGTPAHHLAGRTETVDYQVWVADGDKPLPLRLVLTYPKEKGQPQFRAQLSNWNLSPQVTDATFAFTPPAGATKIAFLAQLPRSVAPHPAKSSKSTKSTPSGEQK